MLHIFFFNLLINKYLLFYNKKIIKFILLKFYIQIIINHYFKLMHYKIDILYIINHLDI
jgi:hypothetical protein